jgi:polyhydroxyalkanoate synthesis regulator phasin
MDPKQIAQQVIQFNKTAFDNTFDAITVLQEQTEKLIAMYMDQTPLLPEEGKKVIADWMKAYKEGRKEFKTAVDENYKKVEEFFTGYDKGERKDKEKGQKQDMISGAPSETVKETKAVKVRPAKKAKKEPKAVTASPPKKAKKRKPRAKKVTNIDTVVGLIQGSTEGISTAELKAKTGLAESQIWNIVNHAAKAGRVKKLKRGVYGAA